VGILLVINFRKFSLKKSHKILLIPLLISSIDLILHLDNFGLGIRSFSGYLSFIILNIVLYNLSKSINFPKKLFIYSLYVWVAVGLIQLFFYNDFFSFMVPNFRFGDARGVLSLAPEPSYLGLTGFYFLIISSEYLKEKKLSFLSIIMILISQSFFAYILMFSFLIPKFISLKFNKKFFFKFSIFLILIPLLIIIIDFKSIQFIAPRFKQIFNYVYENPLSFFLIDDSASDRIFHLYYSFKGFFDNYGFPNGFSEWKTYALNEFLKSDFTWITTGRIMSTYGSILFELGFFGFPIIYFIIKESKSLRNKLNFVNLPTWISFNFSLLFAVPLALPMIALILNLKYFKIVEKNI
jgi:hypothetical protein